MKPRHLLYILLVYCSCGRSKQSIATDISQSEPFTEGGYVYYPVKDNRIPVDLDKSQPASLFDYFKQIELIPLETNDDVLIGRPVTKVIYHQNKYYILDEQQYIVHVFDDTGKFIFRIGKRGQGPEEYSYVYDFLINPFSGLIDLLDPVGFIVSYDLSGRFVKKSDLITNSELQSINKFVAITEKIYVFFPFAASFCITYYDMEGMKILFQTYENYARNNRPKFNEYNNQWYFNHRYDNVTYMLGTDSLIESFTLDFGKHNYKLTEEILPREVQQSLGLRGPEISAKLRELEEKYAYKIWGIVQNNQFVIARIETTNQKFVYLFYDKSTHESKVINRFNESVDLLPITATNEYMLSHCYHEELDKYVSEGMLDEADRQKFVNLMNAKEEENPVIVKYYFK